MQKFDNHKNEMLGGDSEYSDIDVNSGEERDESLEDHNERSYSGASNDLNDSNYSQSKPEDGHAGPGQYYRKHQLNDTSDRKDYSSRNHGTKMKQHGSENWLARDDHDRQRVMTASKQRTSSEKRRLAKNGMPKHSRLPSNSIRS